MYHAAPRLSSPRRPAGRDRVRRPTAGAGFAGTKTAPGEVLAEGLFGGILRPGPCAPPAPGSVPAEQVPGVDLFLHVVQAAVVAVGDDGLAPRLEGVQIVDHPAAEEGGTY